MARTLKMSAAEIAKKQVQNAQGSVSAYKQGVARVDTAPGATAATKKEKYKQAVIDNMDKWAANVGAVPLASWINSTTTKGGDRYSSGVAAAQPKTEAFWNQFLPVLQSVQQTVQAMPNDTMDQRKARMNANFDGLSKFKKTAR